MEIRNIAIIAHVDHGKTAITDSIMKQTGAVNPELSMDNDALEKERGITIYSKNTSVVYKDTKINIVDTPGHMDFGSEVERVLRAIDNVVLVVDAQEGPMPQTRFVLKKSLELGFKPIVVINKIDKPAAQPQATQDKIFELFFDLDATDEQLDFPTVYSIGRDGIAKLDLNDSSGDLTPLLDSILNHVPPTPQNFEEPLKMQVFNLDYDDFLGRLAIGRIREGVIKTGQNLVVKKKDGSIQRGKVVKLFTFEGTSRKSAEEAFAGDIAMVAGFCDINIGETICQHQDQEALPRIKVDNPTISLRFLVNDSPFAGREGKFVTGQQLKERLKKELEVNVGLKIDFSSAEYMEVSGRGELHIAVLLENMRREGYEIQISQPQVITKEIDGVKHEPFEEVTADVPAEMAGAIIEKLGKRKAQMVNMQNEGKRTRIVFEIPTRGLLGYRGQFMVDTKGDGILCSRVIGFKPWAGEIQKRETGSMVSSESGKALGYSLANLQERGSLYIQAGTEVYEGQVIGNTARGDEMAVNPTKGKQLTNVRASGSDDAIQLTPPMELNIEKGIEAMAEDEYLEITPKSIRLRKKHLTETQRKKARR
ncbi:MAG: translational GTPase TypA [Candidatus Moranbacteria bacterium]|nr:translational GTPase TypA [Candidatus Moranbacteria bacterium]